MLSSCIVLFISSPLSVAEYKEFVKQTMACQWYFHVWTLDELQTCQSYCYPEVSIDTLKERYRIYGGVARFVFPRSILSLSNIMEEAFADVDAVKGVRNIGSPTKILATTHTLLHIMVSREGLYQFTHVDIASKYVGEKLWQIYSAQMITNLREMFGVTKPNEISRHLFEIYGHRVFSIGGRTLKCRCLEDDTVSEITLDALNSNRISFGEDTIPTSAALTGSYYEPTDEAYFSAVDSISPQGMFQFTVADEHPIRGVETLRKICKLFQGPQLYFVVPPHRFEKFKKQSFKAKEGTNEEEPIAGLKQYVLELPVL